MKHLYKLALIILIAVATVTAMAGCKTQEPDTLKLALLPIVDVLPMYIAEQNGYFADEGIRVELLPAKSAPERDALLQANEVQGALTDLPGVALFNQKEAQIKVVIMARKAYPDSPMFRLLAAPGSTIGSVADLAGVPIGISQNTVIEYLTDRILQKSGLPTDQIVAQEITAIPVRFEQLMNNQIQAATLPDPLASGAIAAGARLITDDSQFPEVSQSVIAFSLKALEEQPQTIQKFVNAWNKAVADLNANPGNYQALLIEQGRVPESVQNSYTMPPFPEGEITSPEQWVDIVRWLQEKGLVDREIPYTEAIDTSFVKK